jgi:hypothetical protein
VTAAVALVPRGRPAPVVVPAATIARSEPAPPIAAVEPQPVVPTSTVAVSATKPLPTLDVIPEAGAHGYQQMWDYACDDARGLVAKATVRSDSKPGKWPVGAQLVICKRVGWEVFIKAMGRGNLPLRQGTPVELTFDAQAPVNLVAGRPTMDGVRLGAVDLVALAVDSSSLDIRFDCEDGTVFTGRVATSGLRQLIR